MTVLALVVVLIGGLHLAAQLGRAAVHRRRPRRPLQHLGLVSVVVPARNEAATIGATVRSLVAGDYPGIEIIVVDDGSTDGTADIVEALALPGVFVLRQDNAGRAAALGNGIGYARGDLLVLVVGGTVVAPDAVGRLIQPFTDPAVGAVCGTAEVAHRGGPLGRRQHLACLIDGHPDPGTPPVPGAICGFRRAALPDAGGPSGQSLAEDTDLAMAVLRSGRRIAYEPAAVARTEVPATLRRLWRRRCRWCHGTMQAIGRHRGALTQRGPGGRLGRRGLGYLLLVQVLLPLTGPVVDVYAVYGLLFLPPAQVAAVWAGFTLAQAATAAYALHLAGQRHGPLWRLTLQQIVHRQFMCLVVVRSAVGALLGGRLRPSRDGVVADHPGGADAALPPPVIGGAARTDAGARTSWPVN